ncbi:MAG: hypothetical protein KC636_39190, partial [Myxococcales bacterium]|nr:hypothetical protein [Myxococcales bacterium]
MREITTRPTHCAVVEEPAAAWRALWRRSRSPRWAMFLRLYLAGTLLLFALVTAASGPSLSALLAGAAAIFFGTPTVIRGLLAPLERRVLAASRSEASDLLGELRQRKLVKLFAPFAWQSVQEARLHLRRGDGKAAVKALAETARQSIGGEQSPVLLSARGYAHLLAGEPDEAARLLRARAEQGALTPVDRLHLGLASLLSKGGSRSELDRAREHLEAAREAFGGQPQVLAGLALAHQRLGDADAAASALESAELSLGEGDVDDPLAGDLIKRARKALRSYLRSQQKRSRRRGRRSGEVEVDVSEEGDPGSDDAPVEAAKPAQVPHTQDTPPRVEAVVAARVEAVVAAPSEAPAQAKSERADPPKKKDKKEKKPRGKRARKQARREAKRKAKREAKLEGRVDEAATTQTAEPASADARASERSREAAVAATSSASSEASASVPSSAASAALASERVAISSA